MGYKIMTTTKNINELAEYRTLLEETKAIVSGLEDEVKEYMRDNDIDEVLSDDGHKATWREVVSNRFCSTEFKKVHGDLYKAFTKPTTTKRFTFAD